MRQLWNLVRSKRSNKQSSWNTSRQETYCSQRPSNRRGEKSPPTGSYRSTYWFPPWGSEPLGDSGLLTGKEKNTSAKLIFDSRPSCDAVQLHQQASSDVTWCESSTWCYHDFDVELYRYWETWGYDATPWQEATSTSSNRFSLQFSEMAHWHANVQSVHSHRTQTGLSCGLAVSSNWHRGDRTKPLRLLD